MEQTQPGKPQRVPKVAKVKNKAPAEIQITAEQLLREAKERDLEIVAAPPKQKISDPEELAAYRLKKRKGFEDNIRKNRMVIGNWLKYSQWEESQGEIQRARSVYERALDVDHRNITLWLRYAEMEMRSRQVNHARNLWDRAITVMPRVNQFWYKYTYMEEMLGNIAGCRQVFERWMEWHPHEQAWQTYINFELRYKEVDRARSIYERFVYTHPEVGHWIKFARFEEKQGYIRSARKVYERAVEFYGEEYMDEKLFVAFAKFEENQREHERARVIYKYALDNIPKDKSQDLYKAYTIHEKKYGDRTGIESVITSKRRFQYEEALNENPLDYDTWFDLLKLLESAEVLDPELTRETYERAISHVPPAAEKSYWRRYVYLWINYALFEEMELQDYERARQVYKTGLELIPHKSFTFAKLWLLYAHFEVRQKNLTLARKALGMAIGMCPKDKLFRGYIELEYQLIEFDRSRILYQKFLEFGPENCTTWIEFAKLECVLGDLDRARAIYELAVDQPRLDMPEILWKTYIDFEVEHGETERARELYYRLLERTSHVKVWLSLSQFELGIDDENSISRARRVFEKGNERLRNNEKEERLMLLEGWKAFEQANGTDENMSTVMEKMPRKIKKRKKIETADGSEAGWEEYFDYIFPEDEAAKPNLKLLAMAKMWKKKKETEPEADVEPEPAPQVDRSPESEPVADPEDSESEPESTSEQAQVQEPNPRVESEPEPEPNLPVEPAPEPERVSSPEPKQLPQPEPQPSPSKTSDEDGSPSTLPLSANVPEVSPNLPASATEPEVPPESSSSSSSSSDSSSSSSSSSSSDSSSDEGSPPSKSQKRSKAKS